MTTNPKEGKKREPSSGCLEHNILFYSEICPMCVPKKMTTEPKEGKTWQQRFDEKYFNIVLATTEGDRTVPLPPSDPRESIKAFIESEKEASREEAKAEMKNELRTEAIRNLQEIVRTDTKLSKDGRLQMSAFLECMIIRNQ